MTAVSSISSLGTNSATDTITGAGSKTLSQHDFLKLLIAQMTSQDPMNPQTDTQMAAQMAQFTALQQSSTMSDNIATMLAQQQILQANGMLGGTVTLQVDPKTTATGVVQAVQLQGDKPMIVVDDVAYDLSQVIMLEPTPISPPVTPAT